MSDKATLFMTSSFVALGAIANLGRLLWDLPVCIGPFVLPGWTGAFFFIGLGLLAAWSFRSLAAFPFSPPPSDPSNPSQIK